MHIPEEALNQLRIRGLLVSLSAREVGIAKPESVLGNSIPGRKTSGPDETVLDAPCLRLYHKGNQWHVVCHEYRPGPGPGDFNNAWGTIEAAIADVLDYYFGDPSRMNQKARD